MRGQNIIAFAKDWGQDPTSCNHVLVELAKHNKVLWLNSISTRSPNLRQGRDLGRIWSKLASFCRGPVQIDKNLWIYTPVVLPFHNKPLAVAMNRMILRLTVGAVARRMGMRDVQVWTWVPTSAHYLDVFREKLLVYYCTDEWSAFSSVDGPATERLVEKLARRADVVFATSGSLVEKLRAYNPGATLASHGVDYELFAGAVNDDLPMPPDLKDIRRPILGYYGLIEDWLDLGLIEYLASRRPEWSIVLIGGERVDVSALKRLPNVHFLGRKPHTELPAYCRQFSVGLIPHRVNALTLNMNPIKLREYLCAGLPVVSTALPEVRRYPNFCAIAETYDEFERAIETLINEDTIDRRRERSEAMRHETWPAVVASLAGRVTKASTIPLPASGHVLGSVHATTL